MSHIIVVGVDGSETATLAARRAASLASALQARLHVVSAFAKNEVERFASGNEEFLYTSRAEAARTASTAADMLKLEVLGLDVTSDSAEGKPGDVLVAVAKTMDADLIVVGNRRVQGVSRVLGSIARDVASHAPCDVYIAHTHGN